MEEKDGRPWSLWHYQSGQHISIGRICHLLRQWKCVEFGFVQDGTQLCWTVHRLSPLYLLSAFVQGNSYIWRSEGQETFSSNKQSFQIGLRNYSIAGCQEPIKFPSPLYLPLFLHIMICLPASSMNRQKAVVKCGQVYMEAALTGLSNTTRHLYILLWFPLLLTKWGPTSLHAEILPYTTDFIHCKVYENHITCVLYYRVL